MDLDELTQEEIEKAAIDTLVEVWLDRSYKKIIGSPEEHCEALVQALSRAQLLRRAV